MSTGAIATLQAKGAELALERTALLQRVEALAADIAALDRAIAILDRMQPMPAPRPGAAGDDPVHPRPLRRVHSLAAGA